MRQEEPRRGGPLGPPDWPNVVPFEPEAASYQLGWVGLEAVRFRAAPASELNVPGLTHHLLILVTRPPEELDVRYEGVKRQVPPPAGSILMVPAGTPARWRHGSFDWLAVLLEPGLVARVGAEAFGLDPARTTMPPLDGVDLPQLRAAMLAVDAELTSCGAGGSLAAESLANLLAVHLLRHVLAPRQPTPRRYGTLPRGRLRAVFEYVEEHLDASPTLEQMAAIARLSPCYFVRQFKRATGLPPHQYVILRRVERAKQLLQTGGDFSLTEVAASAGFSDQSQFSQHFKRLVGVTPGQFRSAQEPPKRGKFRQEMSERLPYHSR
jgi:AraC family transcriptional regulator